MEASVEAAYAEEDVNRAGRSATTVVGYPPSVAAQIGCPAPAEGRLPAWHCL